MFELFKKAKKIMKEERELKKDMLRLVRAPFDYEALQHIVNEVSLKNVVIEVKTGSGEVITIRNNESENKPATFRQRYENFRSQI